MQSEAHEQMQAAHAWAETPTVGIPCGSRPQAGRCKQGLHANHVALCASNTALHLQLSLLMHGYLGRAFCCQVKGSPPEEKQGGFGCLLLHLLITCDLVLVAEQGGSASQGTQQGIHSESLIPTGAIVTWVCGVVCEGQGLRGPCLCLYQVGEGSQGESISGGQGKAFQVSLGD